MSKLSLTDPAKQDYFAALDAAQISYEPAAPMPVTIKPTTPQPR